MLGWALMMLLWVVSVPITPFYTSLSNPHKLIASVNWTLMVLLLRSVIDLLCGVSRHFFMSPLQQCLTAAVWSHLQVCNVYITLILFQFSSRKPLSWDLLRHIFRPSFPYSMALIIAPLTSCIMDKNGPKEGKQFPPTFSNHIHK